MDNYYNQMQVMTSLDKKLRYIKETIRFFKGNVLNAVHTVYTLTYSIIHVFYMYI